MGEDDTRRAQAARAIASVLDDQGLPRDARGAELVAVGLLADEIAGGILDDDEEAEAWREIGECLSRLNALPPEVE